ncbi:MAG: hypothetical protein KA419_20000 [Acidobacteria bacterium]|nr:hypothetical protein [Acidobacteriota bacterium]
MAVRFDDFGALERFLLSRGDEVKDAVYDLSVPRRLLGGFLPPAFTPAVIVAGTNGKGSVCWWLARALQAAGYRVGLFTSPHLLDLTERVRLDGAPVARERMAEAANRVQARVESLPGGLPRPPTFFEWVTAIAAECFRELRPDVHVLEVGMGGRLDAVNAAEPILSVITGVGYDHCQVLGNDLASIAREKMGVLRPSVPAVLGPDDAWARGLEDELKRKALRVIRSRDVYRERFEDPGAEAPALGLAGDFQRLNAATVMASARELARMGWALSETHVVTALEDGGWPGRMERVRETPPVFVDGAHNPQAMEAVTREFPRDGTRPVAVFGCMKDKDYPRMLALLLPRVEALILTRPTSPRSAGKPDFLGVPGVREGMAASAGAGCETSGDGPGKPPFVQFAPDPEDALKTAVRIAGRDRPVFVLGSLYLAADVKRCIDRVLPPPAGGPPMSEGGVT